MPATVEQWNEFTQDFDNRMQIKEQELNQTLNDPNKTEAEKLKARQDFEKQKSYLDWVKIQNEEIQSSGVAPETLSIPEITSGSCVYIWGGDGRLYPVSVNAPMTSGKMSDTFTFATSTHFNIVVTFTYPASAQNNQILNYESSWPPQGTFAGFFGLTGGTGPWTGYFSWTAHDLVGNFIDSTYNWDYSSSNANFPNMSVQAEGGIPTLVAGSRCRVGAWGGGVTTGGIIGGGYTEVSNPASEEEDNPWDYLNNEINPDIDDGNKAFPDGWEPPKHEDDPDESPSTNSPKPGPDKENRGVKIEGIDSSYYPDNPTPFIEYGVFTYSDLQTLNTQLWNKDLGWFEEIAAAQSVNPMDYFISLRWYPMNLVTEDAQLYPDLYLGRGGRLTVNHKKMTKTIFTVDFGDLTVSPHYENFLDLDPYTKVYIFLPLCGQIQLNSEIVMGKTLNCQAAVDVTDGSIVYQVYNTTDSQPILEKQARIGCEIPISGIDAAQMGANIINASLGTMNTVLGAGNQVLNGARNGAMAGAGLGPEGMIGGALAGAATGVISNAANLIASFSNLGMASKEIVQLTGGTTGMAASLAERFPYIIIQRPLATNPSTYGHTTGWLCNKAATISSMSGFTICKNADTSGIPQATAKEKAEIKKILDSGFYA